MEATTKFILDSGDPDEYREISELAKTHGSQLWGSTTNPTLIAKKLAGKKVSMQEAFDLQKKIVLEILDIVPGAVSCEVYANEKTTADQMIEQGREIAGWNRRVVVKLPTNLEGFKARTALRKNHIPINNTLVFSEQQIFAICLHEKLVQKAYGPTNDPWPPFISPFVGRLDDRGENGIDLVRNGMKIKKEFFLDLPATPVALWMLEASVRSLSHIQEGIEAKTELITIPAKLYREWFANSMPKASAETNLKAIDYWNPPQELMAIDSLKTFMNAVETKKIDISHELSQTGIVKFAQDWDSIIQ